MKKIILTVAVLTSAFSFAQTVGQFSQDGRSLMDTGRRAPAKETVVGSPYITETYLAAKVDGYDDASNMLRYNAAQDEMEFQRDGQTYYVSKSDNMKITFLGNKKVYQVVDYSLDDNSSRGYLVLLSENDKVSLYKKESVKFVPKREAQNSYDMEKPAHYKLDEDKFLIKVNGEIKEFPSKKKALVKLFPQNEKEISEYLKKNKISFSKADDLKQLTEFLNTL